MVGAEDCWMPKKNQISDLLLIINEFCMFVKVR